jgi:hypothetical protein
MAIYKTSRYAYSKVSFVQTSITGYPKPVVFYEIGFDSPLSFYEHHYVQGERLDQISNMYYNVPTLWWFIAQNNPTIKDINNITPGTIIRVPRV